MVDTFVHPVYPELLAACALVLVAGVGEARRRCSPGSATRWAARAASSAPLAGVLVGTLANDSGSVLLVIGTIYLAVAAGFFWATPTEAPRDATAA